MFTLKDPRFLKDLLREQFRVYGPAPVLLLSVPHDSVAFEWLLQDWPKLHANTGEAMHLLLMGATYAQGKCPSFAVPLGFHGYSTQICFHEEARLEGLKWLAGQDARLAHLEPVEAYAIALEVDTSSGSWQPDERPLHAVAQLTTDRGREWRTHGVAELEMVIAPMLRAIGKDTVPDVGHGIRETQRIPRRGAITSYLVACERALGALRHMLE